MTSRYSQHGTEITDCDNAMKRSTSTYNTYSSQIISKYRKSNENSRSTSSLKNSSTSLTSQTARSQSQWYKPKPLQLPPDFEKKFAEDRSADGCAATRTVKQHDGDNWSQSVVQRTITTSNEYQPVDKILVPIKDMRMKGKHVIW